MPQDRFSFLAYGSGRPRDGTAPRAGGKAGAPSGSRRLRLPTLGWVTYSLLVELTHPLQFEVNPLESVIYSGSCVFCENLPSTL